MSDSDVEGHIDALVGKLSVEQKVRLVSGADFWSTCSESALGLGRMVFSDGPAGVRGERLWDERDPSASLPSPSAMAATWDESLIARLAQVLATEAHYKGVHVVLGPTINLHRSPFGGRHFECFSEDPFLTGRLASTYIAALQAFGIGACPKHYVANDSETDRFSVDVRVEEQALREVYLAPFEYAVVAGAWSVMASYNAVNGHTMTESPLLSAPLKSEWGFDGVVISDWTAVRSTEAAGAGGNDLAMPGPSNVWGEPLATAVGENRVPEATLDDKVRRILRLACRVGALDGFPRSATASPEFICPNDLLREAASSGMVLLRNDNDLLPLDAHHLKRVAVLGANAMEPQIQGGGSANVVPPHAVSPLDGIRSALGDNVEIIHHVGAEIRDELRPVPIDMLTNPYRGTPGLWARFLDANGTEIHAEDRHTAELVWTEDELAGVATIEIHTRLRARRPGLHQLGVKGFGAVHLEVDGTVLVDDVIERSNAGDSVASRTRTGEVKLANDDDVDVMLLYVVPQLEDRSGLAALLAAPRLSLVVREPTMPDDETLEAAVSAAQQTEVAIVVVGTTASHESEGFDRTTLTLPGRQNDLVKSVAAANPRTVVVINSGAPIEMPWHTDVPAVLISWFPGQEFGHALADVLLGIREPGGRLPTTWAVSQEDVPVLDTKPHGGRLDYTEGLHIGYRAWAKTQTQPAYPFGHGLGYTAWEYRDLRAPEQINVGTAIEAQVRLANTGDRRGRDVIQVYLRRPTSTIERPAIWLAGYTPVTADPGEETDVTIALEARAFQHWSTDTHQWETELGTFTILVGPSATRLPLHTRVTVNAS